MKRVLECFFVILCKPFPIFPHIAEEYLIRMDQASPLKLNTGTSVFLVAAAFVCSSPSPSYKRIYLYTHVQVYFSS